MSFFKRRFVALLLCVILVLSSTAISVKAKFQGRCDDVIDTFYIGVPVSGEEQRAPSIYDQLCELIYIAQSMCIIADNYSVNSDDVRDYYDWLELALAHSEDDIGYIYSEYSGLWKALMAMEDALDHAPLSDRHLAGMADYSARLDEIDRYIANSGYNENVRLFYQRNDSFPTLQLAELCGVQMPDYFS